MACRPRRPTAGQPRSPFNSSKRLRNAADLEQHFGDAARARMYREHADQAAAGLRRLCWNQQYGLMADTPRQAHFSQHANALGVWLDVIPPEQQKPVLSKVLAANEPTARADGPAMSKTSYYFTYYVTRALEHAGLADQYLSTLAPWRKMLATRLDHVGGKPRADPFRFSRMERASELRLVAAGGRYSLRRAWIFGDHHRATLGRLAERESFHAASQGTHRCLVRSIRQWHGRADQLSGWRAGQADLAWENLPLAWRNADAPLAE